MKNNRRLASFNTLIRSEKGHFGQEKVPLQELLIDWVNQNSAGDPGIGKGNKTIKFRTTESEQ